MGFALPLFVLPYSYLEHIQFDTDRSEYAVMKYMLLIALSGLALVAGSVMILSPVWRRFRGRHAPALLALGAFVAWGGLSVLLSPTPWNSFYLWLPIGLPAAAAATGVLFMSTEKRCRTFLIAMVVCGAIVSLIGVVSSLGVRDINEWIFGIDPRAYTEAGETTKTQGGGARAGSLSTLANPEYAGSFAAVVAAIAAIMLFDWTPGARRKWIHRGFLFGVLGLLLLELVFSGSRQPWVTLGLAGLLRLFMVLRLPIRVVAAGFCAIVLSALFLGIFPTGIFTIALLLAALAWAAWTGNAGRAFRHADPLNRWLVAAVPGVMVFLLIAFSTPGWWNPTGLRIFQRFTSITNADDQSIFERAIMYMAASEMVWESPILGVGPGRYTNQIYPALARLIEVDDSGVLARARIRFGSKIADQPHNDYLQIAAEMGLPALLFFLTVLLLVLAGLWRISTQNEHPRWRLTALGLMFCMVTFSGAMMTSFPLQMAGRGGFFWATVATSLGLISAYGRLAAREVEEGD